MKCAKMSVWITSCGICTIDRYTRYATTIWTKKRARNRPRCLTLSGRHTMQAQIIRSFKLSAWAVVVLPLSYLLVRYLPIASVLLLTVLILDV